MRAHSRRRLRNSPEDRPFTFYVNNVLIVLIVGINLYTFGLPIWLLIQLPIRQTLDPIRNYQNINPVSESGNLVVIPQLRLKAKIIEGVTAEALQKGAWHRPQTGSPTIGGNMVLAGHRFDYSAPSIFANLPSLKIGDEISLVWDGRVYQYLVEKTYQTDPNNEQVEATTNQPKLTLYTCTPMWSAQYRFVVVAKEVGHD